MLCFSRAFVCFLLLLFSAWVMADGFSRQASTPWFTGPLMAPSGKVYPAGHFGFQGYVFYTDDFGFYNHRWKKESTLRANTVNPVFLAQLGLTQNSSFSFSFPYLIHYREGQSAHQVGDVAVTFAYQLLRDDLFGIRPDLKFSLSEAFPTGHFENLEARLKGTDASGAGSYQTALGLTFQKQWHVSSTHFLRSRWNFTYTIPASVHLRGLNAYGGALNTNGTMKLGDHFSTDLAFEYTLNRHWVPAIDILYKISAKNIFLGQTGTTLLGLPAAISVTGHRQLSLAPAIEYNFNSSIGLIAGVWFSVAGQSTVDFVSGVFSLVISI